MEVVVRGDIPEFIEEYSVAQSEIDSESEN